MKQDNSWRQCIICGKFISLKDIQDKRKVVWKQTESDGYPSWDPADFFLISQFIRSVSIKQRKYNITCPSIVQWISINNALVA